LVFASVAGIALAACSLLTDLDGVKLNTAPAPRDASLADAPTSGNDAATDAMADRDVRDVRDVPDAPGDANADAGATTILSYDFAQEGLPTPSAGFTCTVQPGQSATWVAGEGILVDVSGAPTDPTFVCPLPEVKASAMYTEIEFRYEAGGTETNPSVGIGAYTRVVAPTAPVAADDAGRIDLRSSMRFDLAVGVGDLVIFDFAGNNGEAKQVAPVGDSVITLRQELSGTSGATIATVQRVGGPVSTTQPMPPRVQGLDLGTGVAPRIGIANFGGKRRVYLRKVSLVITKP